MKFEVPVNVDIDDVTKLIHDLQCLQTYKLGADDTMVLVSLDDVADVFADHIRAKRLDKDIDVPSKWIPVSERLPEISEKDVYGNVTFSKPVWACMKYGDGFTWQGIDQYTTNNGGGWLSEVPFDDPAECCKVVAWMPLPEPYKEGEQG